MTKKSLLASLICATLLLTPTTALADSTNLRLLVNERAVNGSAEAGEAYINDAGRTMIPLRIVSESMGYTTNWQPDGSIRITNPAGTMDIILTVGSTTYTTGGKTGTFDTAPTLKNNRTYLPARDFSELYGSIYWDNDTRTVWIAQGNTVQYQVIGHTLMAATAEGIQPLAMPDGYVPDDTAIGVNRTIDGITYLGIPCNQQGQASPIPLFRVDENGLTQLTTVYPSSIYVDGSTVYYTDGPGTAPWGNPVQPNRLYAAAIGGDTQTYTLDFAVNTCTLDKIGGQLVAIDRNGVQHAINLGA